MNAKGNKIAIVFIFLVLIGFPLTTCAQDKKFVQQDRMYLYLQDSCENLVGTACGWAGVTTLNIEYTKILLEGNRVDLLQKLLDSNIPATKYLAIQALLLFDQNQLDSLTAIRILELKKSKQAIPICSGCITGYSYSIHHLINDRENNVGKSIREFLADKKE